MAEQPKKIVFEQWQIDEILRLARETRETEFGLCRLVLTVAGGALVLSIGFALGERRAPIPHELLPYLRCGWIVLVASMSFALLATVCTSILVTVVSKLLPDVLAGKLEISRWKFRAVDIFSTTVSAISGVLCILGLGYLAFVALNMAGILAQKVVS